MSHKPKDYLAIRLWGKALGSYDYYIEGEQEKAAAENAPLDATFKRHGTEEWATMSGLPEGDPLRVEYERLLAEKKGS